MTDYRFAFVSIALCTLTCSTVLAQTATSLGAVRTIYIGSLGSQPGAEDLRHELTRELRNSRRFGLVAPSQADAVLEGIGEIWIRGYHSLSPRARANDVYAEPIYSGYLSVTMKGRQGQILWSYFVNPKRTTIEHGLQHDLAKQLVDKLENAVDEPVGAISTSSVPSGKTVTLRGAGATFPFPIYQQWFTSFHSLRPGTLLSYEPVGSEAGVTQLLNGALDFAGSDIPVGELKPGSTSSTLEFPSVVGAVVLIYNLPRFGGDLRLSSGVLARILQGKIRHWNDLAIRALNRRASLPDKEIKVVHRMDGSGTTFALTEYLSKADEDWSKTVGKGAKVQWTVGIAANGNEGVAKLVEQTPYAIGYVEFIYAFRRRLSFASIRNGSGQFIQADLPSIAAAAENASVTASPDSAISLSDSPGRDSYPISSLTWLVVPAKENNPVKAQALRDFIEWVLVAGQRECMALGYVPLPPPLIAKTRAKVHAIQ
jgi:phosphate ABC transporter phosphate-binding protein